MAGPAAASEEAFDCWERAREDLEADFAGVRTVFGYGSLVFRPNFPHQRAYPVSVRGFLRRFWQRSCDHRGTPAAPGRVVTLLRAGDVASGRAREEEPGAAAVAGVHGVAYEVAEADWPEVLASLDVRERHGYVRTVTPLFPPDGGGGGDTAAPCGAAVVYYTHEPAASAAYCGPEPLEATAAVVSSAVGPSGRNDEYVFALEAALAQRGLPPDPHIAELAAAVRALQQARGNAGRGAATPA